MPISFLRLLTITGPPSSPSCSGHELIGQHLGALGAIGMLDPDHHLHQSQPRHLPRMSGARLPYGPTLLDEVVVLGQPCRLVHELASLARRETAAATDHVAEQLGGHHPLRRPDAGCRIVPVDLVDVLDVAAGLTDALILRDPQRRGHLLGRHDHAGVHPAAILHLGNHPRPPLNVRFPGVLLGRRQDGDIGLGAGHAGELASIADLAGVAFAQLGRAPVHRDDLAHRLLHARQDCHPATWAGPSPVFSRQAQGGIGDVRTAIAVDHPDPQRRQQSGRGHP
ncbi:MAG: hypothetical protein L0G94_13615 [Brachybacterium sp.]|uniref:hypothetical protein n=1 Tax=Brachybacterium sp. TaxID=1891286 RepID=UPI002647F354|nr:hypothetical protein [Brachybacterium sp.]MDN5687691.1 hypothetical protein [Brachybacterium sp.]